MTTACSYYQGKWFVHEAGELSAIGDHQALVCYLGDKRLSLVCRDHHALIELASWLANECIAQGLPLPGVSARGGHNGLEFGGVSWSRWRIHTGRSQLSDSDAEKSPAGKRPGGPDDATWAAEVSAHWSSCVSSLGLRARMSAGTTAVNLLPEQWIKASKRLALSEPWQEVRNAYYGGRVQIFDKYTGPAVEHDLVNAYGSVLAGAFGYLPDWKIYPGREPWCDQPGWLDATVRVDAKVAPLPYRLPDRKWQIEWPTSGQWRAWYPLHELLTPGVEIVEVHNAHAGRWDYALEDKAALLLDRSRSDRFIKAVVKQLLVSLAGKLAQKPLSWRIWHPTEDSLDCPEGLYSFTGTSGWLDVYPVRPAYHPPSYLPQVATYVTSKVRCELRSELNRAGDQAIYCDTDSVHAIAGEYQPSNIGSHPGQWAEKARGNARYYARRHYFVGRKRVGC